MYEWKFCGDPSGAVESGLWSCYLHIYKLITLLGRLDSAVTRRDSHVLIANFLLILAFVYFLLSQDRLRYADIPESGCGLMSGIGVLFGIAESTPVHRHTGVGGRFSVGIGVFFGIAGPTPVRSHTGVGVRFSVLD